MEKKKKARSWWFIALAAVILLGYGVWAINDHFAVEKPYRVDGAAVQDQQPETTDAEPERDAWIDARLRRIANLPSWCQDIADIGGDFFRDLGGDDSGLLREYRLYQDAEFPYYALSYYLRFIVDDAETHVILTPSDTWKLHVEEEKLIVERLAPVTGEDRNAALLGSGELVASYDVDLSAGSVLQTFGERYEQTAPEGSAQVQDDGEKAFYIGNTRTGVFHKYGCLDAERMDDEYRVNIYDTRSSMIDRGYTPCPNCKP